MPTGRWLGGALVCAMILPSVLAWWEFHVLAGGGESRLQQGAYGGGKFLQFAFPIVFLWLTTGLPLPRRPHLAGLVWGLAFGLAVSAAMLALYFLVLRDLPPLARAGQRIQVKLVELGAATPVRYLGLAAFVVVAHSLLEEYYWRWFVFGYLRRLLPVALANLVSSLAFMSHHVFILAVYFRGQFWLATVPLSLGVAVGGMAWAWLYDHVETLRVRQGHQPGGGIYVTWLSHALVDAAIFVIGWDLVGFGQRGM